MKRGGRRRSPTRPQAGKLAPMAEVVTLMEAAFGIPGLIAAPIYYAYVKDELVSRKLV